MFIFKSLDPEEKLATKSLWRTVFTEDSKEFTDEYYRGVANGTHADRIFAIMDDIDGHIAAMLHLNYYTLLLGQTPVESMFIVGVATEPRYRKKGFMKSLMNKAIMLAEDLNLPFIYLTAENEALYTPFGFQTVGYQCEITTDNATFQNFIAEWQNTPYNSPANPVATTTLRDEKFYTQYEKELAADGGILLRGAENSCVAYYPSEELPDVITITDTHKIPDELIKKLFTPKAVRALMVKKISGDLPDNIVFNITEMV